MSRTATPFLTTEARRTRRESLQASRNTVPPCSPCLRGESRRCSAGKILASLATLAVALGCFPIEDPDDPIERAKRDAALAERGIIRRRRKARWFLVKTWVESVPANATLLDGPPPEMVPGNLVSRKVPVADEWRLTVSKPPGGSHGSILIREHETGFLALARRTPVGTFELSGRSYGGKGTRADRGFHISVSARPEGRVATGLAGVFLRLGEKGDDLEAHSVQSSVILGMHDALVLDCAPDAADPVVCALFFDAPEDGKPPVRRRLYIQVEAFR